MPRPLDATRYTLRALAERCRELDKEVRLHALVPPPPAQAPWPPSGKHRIASHPHRPHAIPQTHHQLRHPPHRGREN
jgi:hypothetical protein